MQNHRLKAFTVMELLVTLVLSGLIIAAAFTFYLNYERLVRSRTIQMDGGKETFQFYRTFKHELDNSIRMKANGNSMILLMPDKQRISYEFEDDFIVRSTPLATDTFFVKVNNLNFSQDNGSDQIISVELENDGEVFPVLITKKYPNDVLMNNLKN